MQLKLDSRFKKKVEGLFGKYEFQVGILEDGPHRKAKRSKDLGSYAGGPVRKMAGASGMSIGEVSKENRERMKVNYLTEPFKKKSSDIIKFSNEFLKLVFGHSQKKRAENLLQAIVRNPILRGDYGSNKELTKKIKGFDRYLIDTGQWFKAIKAAVKVRNV